MITLLRWPCVLGPPIAAAGETCLLMVVLLRPAGLAPQGRSVELYGGRLNASWL